MRNIGKIAKPEEAVDAYLTADIKNHEGFPAWTPPDREAYAQMLLTNTLGGTFYANENDLVAGTLDIHARMTKYDPEFAAAAISVARNAGFMRLQPIVGLAFLSVFHEDDDSYWMQKGAKEPMYPNRRKEWARMKQIDLFRRTFDQVIRTPGDLQDFVELMRSTAIPRGMGRAIKETINDWLNERMSEYWAMKYNRGGQGYSLADILRLTHPVPYDRKTDAIYAWLTDNVDYRELEAEVVPQLYALEQLKRADNVADQRTWIDEGRLPHEVVTGSIKPTPEIWHKLLHQMPYFALLRHLATLQKNGVFKDERSAEYTATTLMDVGRMKKAKVLPFRLYSAYAQFEPNGYPETLVEHALLSALNDSFVNLPPIGGRQVAIATDISGSMNGRISDRSSVRYIEIGGIFTGALLKLATNVVPILFNHEARLLRGANSQDSLMTIAQAVVNSLAGGTDLAAPVDYLLKQDIAVDTFIGITDGEDWAGRGFLNAWREYRRKCPEAHAYLIRIDPYWSRNAPENEPGVTFIYGWNDAVVKYIAQHSGTKTYSDMIMGLDN